MFQCFFYIKTIRVNGCYESKGLTFSRTHSSIARLFKLIVFLQLFFGSFLFSLYFKNLIVNLILLGKFHWIQTCDTWKRSRRNQRHGFSSGWCKTWCDPWWTKSTTTICVCTTIYFMGDQQGKNVWRENSQNLLVSNIFVGSSPISS